MVKDDKIVSIQYLRGLAALGVVLCHYGSTLSPILNLGQSGVFVFFMITGFVNIYSLDKHKYEPGNFFKFLLKRSIRIDPSYFVTIFLTILLFYILSLIPSFHGKEFHFSIGQLLSHIFYVTPFTKYPFYNHVFWTLCIEFQFYILIGCLYFISKSHVYKVLFLIIFALSSLINMPNSYYIVFNYAPVFAAGISLIELYKSRTLSNFILPSILFLLILYKFGTFIFSLLIISSIVLFYFKAAFKQLSYLGDISYSLYLTHGLVLIVLLGILKRLDINTSNNQFFWLTIEVLTSILFASLFYILIERPSFKLSKRINIKG